MGTEHIEQELHIAEINLNVDTGRAIGVGLLPEDGAQAVHNMTRRYLNALSTMLAGGEKMIHLAYDANLDQSSQRGGRYLFVAGTNPQLSNVVSDTLNVDINPNSIVAVFGPEFCMNWKMMSDETLRRTVAADMTLIFDVHYPIGSSGPIAELMPYLTMIAGQIILQGNHDGDRPVEILDGPAMQTISMMEYRASKAISLAWHQLAHLKFDSFNRFMNVTDHYPAWTELTELVADEASGIASRIDAPLPMAMVGYSVHEAVKRVMDKIGIKVQPCELNERFPVMQ